MGLRAARARLRAGNARNGLYDKAVTTEICEVDLCAPRDWGAFEPVTVPKYQRRLDESASSVISLYAKGLTTGDIQQHLAELYGPRSRTSYECRGPKKDDLLELG